MMTMSRRRTRSVTSLVYLLVTEPGNVNNNHFFWYLKLLKEQGLGADTSTEDMADKEAPPTSAPEEKRPPLSLDELEAKQGNIMK